MNRKTTMNRFNALSVVFVAMTCACFWSVISCGNDEKTVKGTAYDPSKPVVLTSFHPDSGGIASKVIFDGENFGSDPDKIKVYFNQKEAAVIGSTGNRMYAVVPRLPGDTCTVSVVVGGDSVVYDQKFRYKISVSVSTIAGNGDKTTYRVGALDQAILWPASLCCDNEGNIFAVTRNNANGNALDGLIKINEEENSVITLGTNAMFGIRWTPSLFADLNTGIITFADGDANRREQFYSFDAKEGWACRIRSHKWKEGTSIPPNGWRRSMARCNYDGYYYSLYYYGHLVKIDPKTYEAETIYTFPQGECYSTAFHPLQPKMLYFAFWSDAGVNANSICCLDVTDPEGTFQKLTGSTAGGHRDGEVALSQFRQPAQIFFDADGNLYIADYGNHCIRRLNTNTNMVETVVGIPGTAGWKDGGKDEALFNNPYGIAVNAEGTVYVGDYGNARIRKLAIE